MFHRKQLPFTKLQLYLGNKKRLLGKKLKKDSIELLRKSLVYSVKVGEVMVINCDKTFPDFKTVYTHEKEFPTQRIFDFELWNTRSEYMSIVKPDENKDLLGNHDCYLRNPNFQLVVLLTYKSDAEVDKFTQENLPHADKMKKLIVEPVE